MFIRKFLLISYNFFLVLVIIFLYMEFMYDRNTILLINEIFDNSNYGVDDKNEAFEDILLQIYIPRINLLKVVYNMDSYLNDVDYNVQILDASILDNNLFFLAAHSGGGKASYFDDLVYLDKGDIIKIKRDMKELLFVVEEKFYIQKQGYFEVFDENENNTLFLITCSLDYIDKQLIVKAKLIC